MSNHFPTPPKMPRIIRVPAPAFIRRQSAWVRYLFGAVVLALLAGGLWAAWKWHSLHAGMPKLPSDIAEMWHLNREPALEFVDADGNTLAVRGPRYGRAIAVADLPRHIPQAFLAAEDKRFYEHDGADEAAILLERYPAGTMGDRSESLGWRRSHPARRRTRILRRITRRIQDPSGTAS